MSLLRSVLDGAIQIRAEMSGTPAPWDDFWYNPVGSDSASGIRVSPESAKRIGAVLACVNKIAKTVAMLPLRVYSNQADGGKKQATNHPLFDVLYSEPNDYQTAFEFRQMLQGHLELRGNAYAEIIEGPRGPVDQLIPMHPDRVTPQRLRNGRTQYRYNDPLTNQDRMLAQEEVFHLRNFMDDGVVGQSTVAMGVEVFGTALAAQDYYARFLKNDSRPGVVLTGANFKTKQDKDAFKESWQESQTGANRHKVAVLPSGMDMKTLGVSAKDSELLDARKFSRIDICSLFDVPPHLIGETEKTATYASVEQFNIMFVTFCILPRLVLWEQAIQRGLITSVRFFPKFSVGALLRGDSASRASFYQVMIQNGVFSQNDVRIMEDMNPVPDGNNYWRPLNWARLGDVHTSVKPSGSGDDSSSNPGTQPTESPEDNHAAGVDERFIALANASAERCVRKEMAAVRKLLDRGADAAEVIEFYADHGRFLSEVLRISADQSRKHCEQRQAMVLGADPTWQEEAPQIQQLTALAVKGVVQ
jgi:HK97 family phage portal protein